jgi:hypothetical protein
MSFIAIDKTPIWKDIKAIINNGTANTSFEYRALLHTEQQDINVFKIISLDIERDYVNNIADRTRLQISIPLGVYVKSLHPFRDNLEVTIKRIQLDGESVSENVKEKIYIEKFKVIFLTNDNPKISASQYDGLDIETLNNRDFVTVKLEIYNRSLEVLRVKTTSGVFRNSSTAAVMEAVLVAESKKITIDGNPALDGLDIVPSSNTSKRDHITIPSFTNITALPTFLHDKMGGVYPEGIGTYFQVWDSKNMWFVYPLYNTDRFESGKPNLTIYSVPNFKLPSINRTFKKEGKSLNIVATSSKEYSDDGEVGFMNDGVGFRMADARAFMTKPVKMKEDGPVGNRTSLNHEAAIKSRNDELNYGPTTTVRISQNPYQEYAKLAYKNTGRMDIVWENCKHELIYPGMPCRFIFLEEGKMVELKGVVLHMHVLVSLTGTIATSVKHSTSAVLTLAVERHNHTPKKSTVKTVGKF